MIQFERNREGIIRCPWCASNDKEILIENCHHNPFKLEAQVRSLQEKLSVNERAVRVLQDLKQVLSDIENQPGGGAMRAVKQAKMSPNGPKT